MQTFDQAVPPLSQILAGGEVPQQQQPQSPGIVQGARNWFQANPQMATMVLGTMMAAAQGHDIGNAVATGAKMSLAQQAELKQKEEEERLRQEKNSREDQQNQRKWGVEEQRLELDKQRVAQQGKVSDSQIGYYGAQTKELERKSAESKRNEDVQRRTLESRLSAITEQIETSRDSRRTAALQREKLRIENQIKRDYGSLEAETEITGKQLQNQYRVGQVEGQTLQNQEQLMKNASLDRDLRETADMTPEQRASLGKGGGKAPKTELDRLTEFMTKNGELYLDGNGNFDFEGMMKGYQQLKMAADPQAAAANQANRQAQFDAAFAAAKPGSIFNFEGKTYRKPK